MSDRTPRPARDRGPLKAPRLLAALGISTALGVLLAGAAFPVVGGLGLAARAGAQSFEELPEEIEAGPLSQRTVIQAADGRTIATLFEQNRVLVRLTQVPQVVRDAVIAIEDNRFYEHNGVDVKGTLRAFLANSQAGEVTQGGSTLTQQYVKNILVENAPSSEAAAKAREVTATRKLQEARYALALEERLTKDEILEGYLNIAYFGSGAYGVGTAAQRYFSKGVEQLTLDEAALLAGIVKNPTRFDPVRFPEAAQARRDVVLGRMAATGAITEAERQAAVARPVALRPKRFGNSCTTAASTTAFFCDYVREEFYANPAFGATREERQARLFNGGLTIRTSLDPRIQGGAYDALTRSVPVDDSAAAVINIVEPGTGLIKAMAVNRVYGEDRAANQTTLNLATGGSVGFQAGSTMKVFTLAEALRQGMPLSTTIYSPAEYTSDVFVNYTPDGPEPYRLRNAEAYENGEYDMRDAMRLSVNTYFVQLEERTGIEPVVTLAQRMGVKVDPKSPRDAVPAFTLGTSNISPLDMAAAYATFAAHGTYCPPRSIVAVTDSQGRALDVGAEPCRQVLEAGVADTVTDVLQDVVTRGTGRDARIGRPVAGKTGTVQDFGGAWFDGYTPQLAAAVWVGDPRGNKDEHKLKNRMIGGQYYSRVYGGDIPATIFRRAMTTAHEGLPVEEFAEAPEDVADGSEVRVPDVRGLSVADATAVLEQAGFDVSVSATRVASSYARGTVARTSPRTGNEVVAGSTVRLFRSSGRSRSAAPAGPEPAGEPAPAPAGDPVVAPVVAREPVQEPAQEPAQAPAQEPARGGRDKPGKGKGNGRGGG